jgi:hypothetical protein
MDLWFPVLDAARPYAIGRAPDEGLAVDNDQIGVSLAGGRRNASADFPH